MVTLMVSLSVRPPTSYTTTLPTVLVGVIELLLTVMLVGAAVVPTLALALFAVVKIPQTSVEVSPKVALSNTAE